MNIKKALTVKYPTFNDMEENPYQEEMNKYVDITFTEASYTRTLKNITECLAKSLKSKYGICDKEELKQKVNSILKLHGLSPSHFDPMSFVSKSLANAGSTVNDVSVDDNANKSETNMEGLLGESFLAYKKLIGYDFLYQTIKEIYGKKDAKKCMASMFDYSLALNDSTKIMIPYCYCIDASKLVLVGRKFGQVHSSPAKRISTYISILGDTIREISFNIAGACLHHSQNLIMQEDGKLVYKNIKDLVNSQPLEHIYSNYQGDWEYSDVSDKNLTVMEDGRFVKVNKVMRRKYNNDIYEIKTKSGKTVKCSKDHRFKVLYKNRDIEVKAEDLKLYDTVYNTKLTTKLPIDKTSDEYKRGQFIGIICGDGNITNKYDIRISVNDQQTYISDFVVDYVKRVYDKSCSIEPDKRGNVFTVRINSADIYNDIIKDIIGSTALDKHIDVTNKSVDYLRGFMDGILVTDGYYNKSLGFGSISKSLTENVAYIADMLGVARTEITERVDKRGNPNRHNMFAVNMSLKLYDELSLMQMKAQSSKKIVGKRVEDVAYFGKYAFMSSTGANTGNNCKTYHERERKIHSPVTDVIIEINRISNDDNYVYEIETESHWYSVNGILTHNCAIGSIFLDIAHLAIYKERITLDDLRTDKRTRKYITNCFQQFIHTVNHYSRNAIESPFTNVSVFDRDKLSNLISDENYGWYFPKKSAIIEDNELKDSKSEYKNFVLDYIEELQELYLDVFDAGDPLRNGLQYPFPVTTVNLSTVEDETGNRIISPTSGRLLDYITSKDVSRYNIYCSSGTKVASCCFKGDEVIKIKNKDGETIVTSIRDFVKLYSTDEQFGDKIDEGYTITSYTLDGKEEEVKITGVLEKQNGYNELIDIEVDGKMITVTPDHTFMAMDTKNDTIVEITASEIYMNSKSYNLPVESINGMKWNKITKVSKKQSDDKVYDIELEKNHYFSANGIISHNCRLLSDADMLSLGEGVNSFGGSQISLGSHRVITIDFSRCAYEAESYDDFKSIIVDRIEEMTKILKSHRVLIHKLEQLGTQPWITNGWINMSHMFSTYGVIGYNEADMILKDKFNNKEFDYMKDFLVFFNEKCKEVAGREKMIWNIEAIPGESTAVKLAEANRVIFSDEEGYYNY